MVRDDLGHKHGNLVWRVKLACFFTRIGGKHADQIFVNEAKDIIALTTIHGDVFDQMDELADGLSLLGGGVTEFAQASFKRFENAIEQAFVFRVNQAVESG